MLWYAITYGTFIVYLLLKKNQKKNKAYNIDKLRFNYARFPMLQK